MSGLPTAAKLLSFGQAFAALSNLEPFLGQLAISLLFGNFGELCKAVSYAPKPSQADITERRAPLEELLDAGIIEKAN